jgi:hypothetical protein
MHFLTLPELRRRSGEQIQKSSRARTASAILIENAAVSIDTEFDIFLSHSYIDAEVDSSALLGLKLLLNSMGFSVYVDWITDRQLNRTRVSAKTARLLRRRMDKSNSLLFATSETSARSIWMPWELGYMDALTGRVAIVPLVEHRSADYEPFKGQEYLGIYPFVDRISNALFVNYPNKNKTVERFDDWME